MKKELGRHFQECVWQKQMWTSQQGDSGREGWAEPWSCCVTREHSCDEMNLGKQFADLDKFTRRRVQAHGPGPELKRRKHFHAEYEYEHQRVCVVGRAVSGCHQAQ